MKIKLCKGDGKKSKTVYLEFKETEKGVVARAVQEDGTEMSGGALFRIGEKGIFRYYGINESLNLPTDENGYLNIEN